jgi:hypothetical protein
MSNNIKPAMPTVGSFKKKPPTVPINSGGSPVFPVFNPPEPTPVGY